MDRGIILALNLYIYIYLGFSKYICTHICIKTYIYTHNMHTETYLSI